MENKSEKEIKIENRYNVTKDLFISWVKDSDVVVRFRIFWISLSALFIALTIFLIILKNIQDAIFLGMVVFYCLYRALIRNKLVAEKRYTNLVSLYKKSDWERRIVFYEEYFETTDGDINNLKFEYKDITSIEKKDNYIKIKMNSGYIRVYDNSFIKSDSEECERFLNEKMNKE